MARFETGDKISFFTKDVVLRKGEIIKGPFEVDNVDHYQVKWNWVCYEDRYFISPDKVDLICDIPSKKYHYELS